MVSDKALASNSKQDVGEMTVDEQEEVICVATKIDAIDEIIQDVSEMRKFNQVL